MNNTLLKFVYINLSVILTTAILYFAKPLLMPLALAAVLALVFMPLCKWLESKGLGIVLSAIICGIVFSLLVAGIIWFVSWQVQHIASDFSTIKRNVADCVNGLRKYLHDQFGMDTLRKGSPLPVPIQPNGDGIGKMATSVIGELISATINGILVLVYLVMLLCLRHEIRIFVLKLVSLHQRGRTEMVLGRSVIIIRQYLLGLAIVIACLWVMYGIGFTLVGVHNALFFAILCGLLEIVPFVGNLTGSSLTSLMVLSQGGGIKMVLGVLITYGIIQFIQFYIISPLVMRSQVSIHPLFTIVILIAGDLVWGIPGMILAIPALGIVKVICDNVEDLQAFGQLLGKIRGTPSRSLIQRIRSRLGWAHQA
jgi:predicted PurR-regulated permease PerM